MSTRAAAGSSDPGGGGGAGGAGGAGGVDAGGVETGNAAAGGGAGGVEAGGSVGGACQDEVEEPGWDIKGEGEPYAFVTSKLTDE